MRWKGSFRGWYNIARRKVVHNRFTVDSHLAENPLLRTAAKSTAKVVDVWLNFRYYGLTDTLFGPNVCSHFYCFLSRYSGHRAASWKICSHIKSVFFLLFETVFVFFGRFRLLLSINQNSFIFFSQGPLCSLAAMISSSSLFKGEVHRADWNDILSNDFNAMWKLMQSLADDQVFPWK